MVVHRQTQINVGGGNGEWFLQLLETLRRSHTLDELFEAVVGGETQPGRSPAAEIGEFSFMSDAFHGFERSARTVGGSDEGADACAGDNVNGDARFLEHAENANVRDAASKTSSQRETYTGALGAHRSAAIGEGAEQFFGHAQKILRFAVLLIGHNPLF